MRSAPGVLVGRPADLAGGTPPPGPWEDGLRSHRHHCLFLMTLIGGTRAADSLLVATQLV